MAATAGQLWLADISVLCSVSCTPRLTQNQRHGVSDLSEHDTPHAGPLGRLEPVGAMDVYSALRVALGQADLGVGMQGFHDLAG